MKTISVITPFYKGNKYISELVMNINENAVRLKKDYPDSIVELLIVNDSPDCEIEISDSINHDAIEIRIVKQERNQGIHQARVTGLQQCKGDYILFLDQDDSVDVEFMTEQLKFTDNKPDADVVIANAYIEDENKKNKILYRNSNSMKYAIRPRAYIYTHNRIVSPGHCLIRKSAIPQEWCRYILNTNGSDDLFLWLLMFYSNAKYYVNNKCLYTHRYTGINLSASESKMSESSIGFVGFLKEISWFPQKYINPFVRARYFKKEIKNSGFLKKIVCIIKNSDIVLYRIICKISCMM